MSPDEWLAQLRALLPGDVPALSDGEVDALLDLARLAAHTSERWTAPVSTFAAGLALATRAPSRRAELLRALVEHLEPGAGGPGGGAQ